MIRREIEPEDRKPSFPAGGESKWLKELGPSPRQHVPENALVFAQGKAGGSPGQEQRFEIIKLEDEARDDFKKGNYPEAEEKARRVVQFHRIRLGKDAPLALYPPQSLLAWSMSKQGQDASKEFDEAIRLAKLGPVERSKAEIADIYLGKSHNSLDRKEKPDPSEALKAATDGIELLKGTKVESERRTLADLYSARAAARLAVKDTEGAAADLKMSQSLQK